MRARALFLPCFVLLAIGPVAALSSCSHGDDAASPPAKDAGLSHDGLLNAAVCANCHPNAYREWSGSMHAYASEDPVFRAMNRRMARTQNGQLGPFCVNCHAPVAVRLGATKDGTNIDDVPAQLRGVTCFFCHTVDTVNGPFHNNPLVSGSESTFRAAIADPLASAPHGAEGSPLLDQTNERSIPLCGACHDIQLPQGTSIERTFFEWQHSRFGLQEGQAKTGCGTCHMPARAGRAAEVPGAPMRTVHDHSMVGVDLAIAPFPEKDAQRQGVHSFLDTAVIANLCVRPGESGAIEVEVDLTNTTVGHNWPSGSNQDRRAWVKLTATKGTDTLLSIGDVPDDKAVELTPGIDSVALFRDHLIDANGNETRMFWEAARYTSLQLPAAITSDPATPGFDNTYRKTITVPGGVSPDTVHMEVRIRPIDYDLVDDLIASGDLDPAAVPGITTFTLTPTSLDWTADRGFGCVR